LFETSYVFKWTLKTEAQLHVTVKLIYLLDMLPARITSERLSDSVFMFIHN